jgi:hypothetical protein
MGWPAGCATSGVFFYMCIPRVGPPPSRFLNPFSESMHQTTHKRDSGWQRSERPFEDQNKKASRRENLKTS